MFLGREWNACDGRLGDTERIGWDPGSPLFVRGIQVCMNRANDRVKSVRLYPAFVWNGAAVEWPSVSEFERANFDHWDDAEYCEEGEVATKVQVHRNDDEMVGLSLQCREVTHRP